MRYQTLGRTGLRVSHLGFGGAPAGLANYVVRSDPDSPQQRRTMRQAIERALELGITYFDTAPGYGDGLSESIFGEALAGAADGVVIASKVGLWETDPQACIERSLVRLRRQRVDLVQLHGTSYTEEQADQVLRSGGVLDQLVKTRDRGLVRFIGLTSEDVNPPVWRMVQSGRFDILQVQYNLLFQHPWEPTRPFGIMLEAERRQMGIVTMRSATSGLFQRWMRLIDPDNTRDYTPELIRFVLSNRLIDVALVGMRSAAEVERNVAIEALPPIDLAALHERFV
jgi:aryl-alcohol dehydrogenase-like predicted oxidoreductase